MDQEFDDYDDEYNYDDDFFYIEDTYLLPVSQFFDHYLSRC